MKRTEWASHNERFAKIAALSRIKGSGILEACNPLEGNRLPQLRQAATTLCVMRAKPSSSADLKKNKVESFVQFDNSEESDNFLKIVGFCRVRYAHTAPPTPRPKMGFAIFRLCPPTRQADGYVEQLKKKKKRKLKKKVYLCIFEKYNTK